MRRVVQANLSRGVDWIKVLATERAGTPDTDPRKQVYTEAELARRRREAATKNVPVQAHAHGAEGALAAVKAGVRSIEHGTYLTDEALQLMAKQGTYFDPTMEALKDVADVGGDYDNRDLQLRGRHMLPRLREAIARAHKMGVKIVAGSDTGYGPASVGRVSIEVADLVECGLDAAGRAAGRHHRQRADAAARETDRTGGAGFEADLVVVERNPLEQIARCRIRCSSSATVASARPAEFRRASRSIATVNFADRISEGHDSRSHWLPTRHRSRLYLLLAPAGCCSRAA